MEVDYFARTGEIETLPYGLVFMKDIYNSVGNSIEEQNIPPGSVVRFPDLVIDNTRLPRDCFVLWCRRINEGWILYPQFFGDSLGELISDLKERLGNG